MKERKLRWNIRQKNHFRSAEKNLLFPVSFSSLIFNLEKNIFYKYFSLNPLLWLLVQTFFGKITVRPIKTIDSTLHWYLTHHVLFWLFHLYKVAFPCKHYVPKNIFQQIAFVRGRNIEELTLQNYILCSRFAKVSILCVREAVLTQPFRGQVRKEDVRATEKDRVEMYKSFRPGDVILARILSLGTFLTIFSLIKCRDWELGINFQAKQILVIYWQQPKMSLE